MLDPDAFETDWYGYVTNQAGHAFVIGTGLALVALVMVPGVWAIPLVAAVYFVGWEVLIQRGNLWADSLEDAAFVAAGAAPVSAAMWYADDVRAAWLTVAACYMVSMAALLIGAVRRWQP